MPELASPMRGVILENVDLTAGGVGQVSDGQTVGDTGAVEAWALFGQDVAGQNGAYTVTPAGVWARHPQMADPTALLYKTYVNVRGGTRYKNSVWYYEGDSNPAPGAALTFKLHALEVPRMAGNGLQDNAPFFQLPERAGVAGRWTNPTFLATDRGVIEDIESSDVLQTLAEGAHVTRISSATLTVGPGRLYAPNAGVISWEATIVKTALVLTAATWYYLYARLAEGVAEIEVSAQRPAAPYFGAARVKGGGVGGALDNTNPDTQPDYSMRYVPNSAFYASQANTARRFRKLPGGRTLHLAPWDTAVADGGLTVHYLAALPATADSPLATDLSALVPPTSRVADIEGRIVFVAAGSLLWARVPGTSLRGRFLGSVAAASATQETFNTQVETDGNRQIEIVQSTGATANLTLACISYEEEV